MLDGAFKVENITLAQLLGSEFDSASLKVIKFMTTKFVRRIEQFVYEVLEIKLSKFENLVN